MRQWLQAALAAFLCLMASAVQSVDAQVDGHGGAGMEEGGSPLFPWLCYGLGTGEKRGATV